MAWRQSPKTMADDNDHHYENEYRRHINDNLMALHKANVRHQTKNKKKKKKNLISKTINETAIERKREKDIQTQEINTYEV